MCGYRCPEDSTHIKRQIVHGGIRGAKPDNRLNQDPVNSGDNNRFQRLDNRHKVLEAKWKIP